jgi:transmembrane sensor
MFRYLTVIILLLVITADYSCKQKKNYPAVVVKSDTMAKRNEVIITLMRGVKNISTPIGGQYHVTLPDGTKVWLNAASGITYPTAFTGKTREVKITGEAYFEVVKDPARLFSVKTYRDIIKVTGTSFNINSYGDERFIKTSLLKGSVKINADTLQPGQAYENGLVISTNTVQDIAWKNDFFDFDHTSMEEAMKQIARWYGVEVRYDDGVPSIRLAGRFSRRLPLQQLVNKFDSLPAHFTVAENVLHVKLLE